MSLATSETGPGGAVQAREGKPCSSGGALVNY